MAVKKKKTTQKKTSKKKVSKKKVSKKKVTAAKKSTVGTKKKATTKKKLSKKKVTKKKVVKKSKKVAKKATDKKELQVSEAVAATKDFSELDQLDPKGLAARARQIKKELLAIRFNLQTPSLKDYLNKKQEIAQIMRRFR